MHIRLLASAGRTDARGRTVFSCDHHGAFLLVLGISAVVACFAWMFQSLEPGQFPLVRRIALAVFAAGLAGVPVAFLFLLWYRKIVIDPHSGSVVYRSRRLWAYRERRYPFVQAGVLIHGYRRPISKTRAETGYALSVTVPDAAMTVFTLPEPDEITRYAEDLYRRTGLRYTIREQDVWQYGRKKDPARDVAVFCTGLGIIMILLGVLAVTSYWLREEPGHWGLPSHLGVGVPLVVLGGMNLLSGILLFLCRRAACVVLCMMSGVLSGAALLAFEFTVTGHAGRGAPSVVMLIAVSVLVTQSVRAIQDIRGVAEKQRSIGGGRRKPKQALITRT